MNTGYNIKRLICSDVREETDVAWRNAGSMNYQVAEALNPIRTAILNPIRTAILGNIRHVLSDIYDRQ